MDAQYSKLGQLKLDLALNVVVQCNDTYSLLSSYCRSTLKKSDISRSLPDMLLRYPALVMERGASLTDQFRRNLTNVLGLISRNYKAPKSFAPWIRHLPKAVVSSVSRGIHAIGQESATKFTRPRSPSWDSSFSLPK